MEVGGVKGTGLSCWVRLPTPYPQSLAPAPPPAGANAHPTKREPRAQRGLDARVGGVRAVHPRALGPIVCHQARRPSGKWWTVPLTEPHSLHFLMVFSSPLAAPHESNSARSEPPFCSQRKGQRGWGCMPRTGEVAVTHSCTTPSPAELPAGHVGPRLLTSGSPIMSQALPGSPGTCYQSTFSAHLLCELHSPGRHPAGRWAFLMDLGLHSPPTPALRSPSPGTLTW